MRRRHLLLASLSAVTGCTTAGYRPTGPRTPPPAPETDVPSSASDPTDPTERRAQAVIRRLNELYRLLRAPLGSFDVEDVTPETLETAEASLARAREALASFSDVVVDAPPRYRSLPVLVTAHERLLDGLAGAVECWSALSGLEGESVTAGVFERAHAAQQTLVAAAAGLRETVEQQPTVPAAVFLTVERLRDFAAAFETQSMAAARLVDASERLARGTGNWRTARAALERDAFQPARTGFDDARTHYRTAAETLDSIEDAAGSFADLVETRSCVATAGVEATRRGLDAVDAAVAGDVARAERLLERAETTRNRCVR